MSETIYDGPPSPSDTERALVEVAAERDHLRQQVVELLGSADAVLALRVPLGTGSPYLPDNWETRGRLRELDEAADQVRKELEGHG